MIDTNVARQERRAKDDLYEEVLQHWDLAKTRCHNFMGQEEALEVIMMYCTNYFEQQILWYCSLILR